MVLIEVHYIVTAILVAVIAWLFGYFYKLSKLPAGPWGLPIVGYIPWMGKNVAESFIKISEKYGSIFSVNLGSETVVVFNDWQSIKACLVDQPKNFTERPDHVAWNKATSKKDLGSSNGPIWERQRSLIMDCMKRVGMGKSSMENLVMESIQDVINSLMECGGKTIQTDSMFFIPFLKISWKLLASHDFDTTSKDMSDFDQDIRLVIRELRPDNIFNLIPWLRFLPPNGFGFKPFIQASDRLMSYVRRVTISHLNAWEDGSEMDLIDHYITKIKSIKKTDNSEAPYTFDYLVNSLWGLFIAGVDTINATILWALLFLSTNPDVQKEAQDELDSVVGKNRLPCLTDFSKLPYVEAVIMEIHRLANVTPLNVPHVNKHATTIGNVTIPKGLTCIQNTYRVHRDPNLWEEPLRFNPKRFINDNNEAKAPPYLMPFSIGPRMCAGKAMAEINLKLFIGCLLHQFSFDWPSDGPKPSFDIKPGLVVHPQSYSVVVHIRNIQ